MGFADDKLYAEFIRPQMPVFVIVRVRDILLYLCCLTESDRDEILAHTEMRGNRAGMQMLLDYIRRRENWPKDLIQALKSCGHPTLAKQMEDKYESLKLPHERTASRAAPEPSPVPPSHLVSSQPAVTTPPLAQTALSDRTAPNDTHFSPAVVPPHVPQVASEPLFPGQPSSPCSHSTGHTSIAAVTPPSQQVSLVKPVQDTNGATGAAKEQEVKYAPTINEVCQGEEFRRRPASAALPLPASSVRLGQPGGRGPSHCRSGPEAWEGECFSKPGVLRSILPPSQIHMASPEGPYSGDSARLEISSSSATPSNCSGPADRELHPSQPEQSQCGSASRSFGESQVVRRNVIRVSEGAAVQNYAGQALPTSDETPRGTIRGNSHLPSPPPPGEQGAAVQYRYLAAAMVVLIVLVIIWKYKYMWV